MNNRDIYLGGAWVPAQGRDMMPVIDPSTEQCVATVPECSAEDVDAAVQAAWKARSALRAMSVEERADMLLRLAGELERRSSDLAELHDLDRDGHAAPAQRALPGRFGNRGAAGPPQRRSTR